jgi:hypothetical protein
MDYELRYCAFVDILGFSELVRRLEQGSISFGNLQQLLRIVHTPPSEYRADVFKTSDLRAQSISDAVCLSAACSEAGLAHLIYCLDELTIRLLGAGFFVRGAIVKGRLFHDDKMVFGEALVLAYRLETEVARYPRIMIARDVAVDIQAFCKLRGHQTTFPLDELQFLLCLVQASDGPYYLHVLREIGFNLTDQKDEERRAFSISGYNRMHTNNFRTLRGRTLLAVIGDETSFWRDDSSASPDVETFRACVPALAAAGGIWVGISTGYRKMGLLYQKWRDHFGQSSDDVLVVQGATENFNPILNRAVIDKAKAADPEASESEWMGGWRDDIAAFLDDALVDAAIDPARPQELPPRRDLNYVAFCDASGGRKDAFTLCIGHREGERYIADVVRGKRAPFDPNAVVAEYAALLKEYRVRKLSGDNYSAAWVEMAWKAEGLIYERSELAKSGIYLESLPLFVRQVVAIPEQSTLTRELRLLERRTSRAGKDIVDHGRTGSDDYANSLCGLLYLLTKKTKYRYDTSMKWVDGGKSDAETNAEWRADRLRGYMTYGGNRRLF